MDIQGHQARDLLNEISQRVGEASTAHQASETIGRMLKTLIPSLWRTSVSKLVSDGAELECVAVWSEGESTVKPGLRVSTLVTSFPEVVRLGRPVVSAESVGPKSMLKRVLMSERTRSWVAIPLAVNGGITGLLGLSAGEGKAFELEDRDFYASLGRGVEGSLVALM